MERINELMLARVRCALNIESLSFEHEFRQRELIIRVRQTVKTAIAIYTSLNQIILNEAGSENEKLYCIHAAKSTMRFAEFYSPHM